MPAPYLWLPTSNGYTLDQNDFELAHVYPPDAQNNVRWMAHIPVLSRNFGLSVEHIEDVAQSQQEAFDHSLSYLKAYWSVAAAYTSNVVAHLENVGKEMEED